MTSGSEMITRIFPLYPYGKYLAEGDFFPFPDYKGKVMSIIDACPTREQTGIHKAIRTLLKKMNITLVEPERTGIYMEPAVETLSMAQFPLRK